MGWFRIKRREAKPLAPHQEKTANKIAQKILAVQRGTAAKLNTQAQKLGKRNTLLVFGTLLLGFALYCTYLLVGAFF